METVFEPAKSCCWKMVASLVLAVGCMIVVGTLMVLEERAAPGRAGVRNEPAQPKMLARPGSTIKPNSFGTGSGPKLQTTNLAGR